MTTITPFTPSTSQAFSFQPTLDNQVYLGVVQYNQFGKRYYLVLQAQDGTIIFNLPLIGSPTGFTLATLGWADGIAYATTTVEHSYTVGLVVDLTLTGCAPDVFNGIVPALITGPSSFQWLLPANPGIATGLGQVTQNINMAAGYFTNSTLVFSEASSSFVVSP